LAGAVRTRPGTQLAADALVLVDEHDAVLGALVACPGRTHRHASRRLAMQAGAGEVDSAGIRNWGIGIGKSGLSASRCFGLAIAVAPAFTESRIPNPESRLHQSRFSIPHSHFVCMYPVEPDAVRFGSVRVLVRQRAE